MKNFAIDFDDTLTAAPALISKFIREGKDLGYSFWLVTARRDSEENTVFLNEYMDKYECQMPIIFCNLKSKVDTVNDRGIRIDIWMDDAPYALVHGHV